MLKVALQKQTQKKAKKYWQSLGRKKNHIDRWRDATTNGAYSSTRDLVCNHCCRVLEPGRLREAQIAILKHRLTLAQRCRPTGSLLPPHAAHGSAADPQHRGSLGPAGTRTPRRTRRRSPSSVMSPVCGAPSAPRAAAAAAPGSAVRGRPAPTPHVRRIRPGHGHRPPPRGPSAAPGGSPAAGKPWGNQGHRVGAGRTERLGGGLAPRSPPFQPLEVSGM